MKFPVYQWVDRIWQKISEIVFIRFDFDMPLEVLNRLKTCRIIFTLTSGGIIEWLILSSWCRRNGFDAILVSNRKRVLFFSKPKYFFQTLLGRKSHADLFLSEVETGPRLLFCPSREKRKRPFDPTPVENLLSHLCTHTTRKSAVRPFCIIPVLILWRKFARGSSRTPSEYLLGIGSRPNIFGKIWYLIRKRRDSTVRSLSEIYLEIRPIEEAAVPEETEAVQTAKSVRRKVLIEINRELRVVIGPRYLSTHSVKESLLKDPDFQSFLNLYSKQEKIDKKKVMMLAYKNFGEIVANYRYRTIEVFYVLLTWLFTKVFEGVETKEEELQDVRDLMKTRPIVFVSAHRSHFDYLVIPYVLFLHDMVTPHIAAGLNLKFWPIGSLLRSGGAFFIRRSFRGDLLYSTCLKKYVEYLLKNRIPIKFFIEGTRSRTGKMLAPAYGLLKMVLDTVQRNACEDVALVPVSISYDQVPEQGSYGRELSGGQKTKESARNLIRSGKLIKNRFGRVHLHFAKPILVRQIFQSEITQKQDSTLTLQKAAFQVCKSINDATPITPTSLVATVCLASRTPTLSLQEILALCSTLGNYALSAGNKMMTDDEESLRRAIESNMRRLHREGTLRIVDNSVPRLYFCEDTKRIFLSYYRNTGIQGFVLPSIVLLSFFQSLNSSSDNFSNQFEKHILELRNLMKFEFFFDTTERFKIAAEKTVKYFFGTYPNGSLRDSLSCLIRRLLKWDTASLYMRILGDLLESYSTTCQFFIETPTNTAIDKKSLAQKVLRFATSRFENEKGHYPESVSVQNYSNAILLVENLKCLSFEPKDQDVRLVINPELLQQTARIFSSYLSLAQENIELLLIQKGFKIYSPGIDFKM